MLQRFSSNQKLISQQICVAACVLYIGKLCDVNQIIHHIIYTLLSTSHYPLVAAHFKLFVFVLLTLEQWKISY